MVGIIDQNRRLGNRHALLQFAEKQYGKLRCSGRERAERGGICSSRATAAYSQQRSLFTWINHLVDRDVIRRRIAGRLYVGPLHSVMDSCSTPIDTQPLKMLFGIQK